MSLQRAPAAQHCPLSCAHTGQWRSDGARSGRHAPGVFSRLRLAAEGV